VKHYARITETLNVADVILTNNVEDRNYSFDISLFARATEIAKNFKYFRAKRCVWRYVPRFNTYQSFASGTAPAIPDMTMIMNRTGDLTIWTQAEYNAQGAMPTTFTKQKTVSYKPNLVQSLLQAPINPGNLPGGYWTLGATPKYDIWLATNVFANEIQVPYPSPLINGPTARYQGHSMIFTGQGYVDGASIAEVYLEVEWEFKDPYYLQGIQSPLPPADNTEPLPAVAATTN